MPWEKEERMKTLDRKICDGEVDRDILPLIESINASPDYFTTSSCAGRIVLLAIPGIGDKEEAEFLGRWHGTVDVDEVKERLSHAGDTGLIFLLAQSPIIHVRCRNLASAVELRNRAVESGMKYSTLKSLKLNSRGVPHRIVVEILSSENIHVPVACGQRLYPDDDYLAFLVESANQVLNRAREKLVRFHESLAQSSISSMSLGR